MLYATDYCFASDSDSNANTSHSNEDDHEGHTILESLMAQLRSSKRQRKGNRSQNIIGHAYNAAILCEPKGKRALKGWERVLLQHYMETSSRWDEIEPPALIKLWKACKLNTVGHRRDYDAKVRSKAFTTMEARDTSHIRYEKILQNSTHWPARTFFSFAAELVAIVRPFIVKVDKPRPILQITGTRAFEIINISQIKALCAIVRDPEREREYIIERDTACIGR